MIRQIIAGLSLASALAAATYMGLFASPAKPEKVFEPQPVAGILPTLEGEDTPFFSKQLKTEGGFKIEDILCYRKDHSIVHLIYGKNNLLLQVRAFRNVDNKETLAYEAQYDVSGRRIVSARNYGASGSLETLVERHDDGSETYSFYRAAQLIQKVELAADGSSVKANYENGKLKSEEKLAPPAQSSDLVFWDAAKTQVRLRVNTRGGRLASFEYLSKEGKLDHSGKVLPDGSLEFSYMENGKLKCRQVWALLGQDWERSYYSLSVAQLYADDEKTVENRVWLRSNGSRMKHERYNAKTAELEMRRFFDNENRVSHIEEYNQPSGAPAVKDFPASEPRSRGFVPDGLLRFPGTEASVDSVYNLEGTPFSHSPLDLHPWAFFELAPKAKAQAPTLAAPFQSHERDTQDNPENSDPNIDD